MLRFLCLCFLLLLMPASAQEAPVSRMTYMIVECYIHKLNVDITTKKPEEKRIYVSLLATPPAEVQQDQLPKIADAFFNDDVLAPLLARDLSVRSWGNGIQIYGGAERPFKTDAQAQESCSKRLEDLKAEGGNIYTFTWIIDAPKTAPKEPKEDSDDKEAREEARQKELDSRARKVSPKLFYRDGKQPHYEGTEPRRSRF